MNVKEAISDSKIRIKKSTNLEKVKNPYTIDQKMRDKMCSAKADLISEGSEFLLLLRMALRCFFDLKQKLW